MLVVSQGVVSGWFLRISHQESLDEDFLKIHINVNRKLHHGLSLGTWIFQKKTLKGFILEGWKAVY